MGVHHTHQAFKDWWSKPFCKTLTLTFSWRDSLLSNIMSSLRYKWHVGPQPHPLAAITKTHLSCKLICNYDFGKSSKETQKGLIEWHFPMHLSPDKWDKMLSDVHWLQIVEGKLLESQGAMGTDMWGVVMGIQQDKYRQFAFAKLRWEILPLRSVHCKRRDRKTNLATIKVKCHTFSHMGFSGAQSEAWTSAYVREVWETWAYPWCHTPLTLIPAALRAESVQGWTEGGGLKIQGKPKKWLWHLLLPIISQTKFQMKGV